MPKPTKLSSEENATYDENAVYGCLYDSGHECKISPSNAQCNTSGDTVIRVPVAFQKKCRKEIVTRHEDIRSWFNPKPSMDALERYVSTPETHTTKTNPDEDIIGLKMAGILIDNGRIYPKYEAIWKRRPGLVIALENDIQEVTDLDVEDDDSTMVLKAPRERDDGDTTDGDDDGDSYNEGGDDDRDSYNGGEDDDDTVTDAIRKIQDTIDIAREELAKLARTRQK